MLRVGLTGGLGSGKSTVAQMLQRLGAHVISADDLGRQLMVPGTDVFRAIVARFGNPVVGQDGRLDRAALARLAFGEGRVEELNQIVHPATIRLQRELADAIFRQQPHAIVVVESALIFETRYGETAHGAPWRERFDRIILVTAPDALKISRFIERSGPGDREALQTEAKRRLSRIIPDEIKAPECDFLIPNQGTIEELEQQVDIVWERLNAQSQG